MGGSRKSVNRVDSNHNYFLVMKPTKKLKLNYEKVSKLNDLSSIRGGKEMELAGSNSTDHAFTCGWCTQITKGNSCVAINTMCV